MSDADGGAPFAELTDLAARSPDARALVLAAIAERLGNEEAVLDFHRHWNGGWRCRASIAGRGTLEFVLLITATGGLLAFPVPMPNGWRLRGVADNTGARWTTNDDGAITALASITPSPE